LKDAEMLHYGTAVQFRKFRAKVSRRFRFVAQQVQQLTPTAVGECFEYEVLIFLA
jgi:hypothetical protein